MIFHLHYTKNNPQNKGVKNLIEKMFHNHNAISDHRTEDCLSES